MAFLALLAAESRCALRDLMMAQTVEAQVFFLHYINSEEGGHAHVSRYIMYMNNLSTLYLPLFMITWKFILSLTDMFYLPHSTPVLQANKSHL